MIARRADTKKVSFPRKRESIFPHALAVGSDTDCPTGSAVGWTPGCAGMTLKNMGALATLLLTTSAHAGDEFLGADFAELRGEASVEAILFPEDPLYAGQDHNSLSFAIEPTGTLEWNGVDALGGTDITATIRPFLRIDTADDERTHFDFREAKLDMRFGDTDVTIGNDIVFWGKTEVDQLVDIVNQVDGVEGTDGEDKLGQPMIAIRRIVELGDFSGQASAFYFPYFRERTFLGEESRLRSPIVVDGDDARYETGAEEWTPSFAARLAGFYGDIDAGFHVYHGLSRDPAFEVSEVALIGGQPVPSELRPVYGRITQVGFDGQYTSGATLWKAEAIGRFDQRNLDFEREDYAAAIAGVEHTLYGIGGTNFDLGLIAEYAYDSRGSRALTPFENDLVLGARFALNDAQDTSALVTAAVDTETQETVLRLEGERRLGDSFKLEVVGQAFLNTDDASLVHALRDDHSLRITLSAFW